MAGGRLGRAAAIAGMAGIGVAWLPGLTVVPGASAAQGLIVAQGRSVGAEALPGGAVALPRPAAAPGEAGNAVAIPRPAATTPTPVATPATGPGADTGQHPTGPPAGSPAGATTGPPLGLDAGYPTDTGTCRPGSSPSLVVPTPATPVSPGTLRGTVAHPPTGTRQCVPLHPQPFPAPPLAPSDVVGGAGLAGTDLAIRPAAGIPPPPSVDAVSYLVADLDSGDILLAKGAHDRLRPASCLKTLTAATLIPLLPPERTVVATADMVAANGTRIGMVAGTSYRVDDLMRALLVDSANDAAYGLAEAAGGYDATVALLNAKAAALGAFDTVVVDPSGLDEPGQMSSAYDLALFARAGWQLPAFRGYVGTRQADFPMPPPSAAPTVGKSPSGKPSRTPATPNPPPTSFQYSNINAFLFGYPGAVGIKTGRTDRAKHTFVGAATRDGRTLLVVWMGALSADWHPTAALFDWSFTYASRLTPVGTLVAPGTAVRPAPLPATAAPSALAGRPRFLWVTGAAGGAGHPGSGGRADARSAADGMTAPWMVGGGLVLLAVLAAGTVVGRREPQTDEVP